MLMAEAAQTAALSLRIFRTGYSRGAPGQLSLGWEWPHIKPHARRARSARRDMRGPVPVQRSFKLRVPPPVVMTPLMGEIERILARLAENGSEMPNNPVLGQRCQGRRRNSVDRALQRLQALGRITIERERGRRRVLLNTTGLRTGWGESRPGHAPFCSRKRNDPPLPPKPRLPESQPLRVSDKSLPELPSLAGWTYTKPATAIGAAATCQWPLWGDDVKPSGLFCDAPVNRQSKRGNCSWCVAHEIEAYR